MSKAIARAPEGIRGRLTGLGGLDLSGTIATIDRWGDGFPSDQDLARFAAETASALGAAIRQQMPEPPDVVLSASLMSQLYLPVRDTLLLGMADWQKLFAAIDRAHLATLAEVVRPGGSAVVALDVVSSHKLPELTAFVDPATWAELAPAVDAAIKARQIPLSPDPQRLLALLAQPPLGALVERARLTDPWVWNIGEGVAALVYGLLFNRVG